MLRLEPPGPAVLLPGYGPYRVLIDTGLTETFDDVAGILIGFIWVIGLALVVVILFTRETGVARRPAQTPGQMGLRKASARTAEDDLIER